MDRPSGSQSKEDEVIEEGENIGQAVVVEVGDHRRTDFAVVGVPSGCGPRVSEGAVRQDDECAGREAAGASNTI
jgi:hypothetical protein